MPVDQNALRRFGLSRREALVVTASLEAVGKQSRGNGFLALGDSISTAGTASTGGGGYGAAWPHLACALTNQRLSYVGNAGVAGETAAQVAARVPTVIAMRPEVVALTVGTNDLTNLTSTADYAAAVRSIVRQLMTAGIRVVICTIPPRGTSTYMAQHLLWNRWLKALALDNGLDLIDWYALLVDTTTGLYQAAYNLDGIHPTQAAHVVMAQHLVANLDLGSVFTPIGPTAGPNIDGGNLIANPFMTAGSPTPSAYAAGGTAGLTGFTDGLVTDTDFKGKAWEIAFANPSVANGYRLFASVGVFTGFQPGDQLLFTAKAKVVSAAGVVPGNAIGLTIDAFFNGASTVVGFVQGIAVPVAAGTFQAKAAVPAGTTNIQLVVNVKNIPTTGSLTARVGEFGIVNLSTLPSTAL